MTAPLRKINDFIIRFVNAQPEDIVNDPRLQLATGWEVFTPEQRDRALENLQKLVRIALDFLALYGDPSSAKRFIETSNLEEDPAIISVSIEGGEAGKNFSLTYKAPEVNSDAFGKSIIWARLMLLDFLLSQGHRRLGKCEVCNKFFLLRRAKRKGKQSGRLCYKPTCKKEFERRRLEQKRKQRKAEKERNVALTG